MKFKDLPIGARFEFASRRQWWARGMATGPWVKTGPRTYEHAAGGQLREHYGRIRIGSINAEVERVRGVGFGANPRRKRSRRRKRRRNPYRKSMTFGVMPPFKEFKKAFDEVIPDGEYEMRLGRTDVEAAEGTILGTGVYSAKDLYKGVQQLTEKFYDGDDNAGSLASSIMETLGFEWI